MARIDIKKDKNNGKEKVVIKKRKDGDPNDWAGFTVHIGICLLYTLIYGLLGANFIIYASLTKDKKEDDEYSRKLNKYFRVDKEYYNCIGASDDDCTKVYDEIPYRYYDRIPEDYTQQGLITRMLYLFFPNYTPVQPNETVDEGAHTHGAAAANGQGAPAANGQAPADGKAPADGQAAPAADGQAAPAADGQAPAADGQAAPAADGQAAPEASTSEASTSEASTSEAAPASETKGGSIIKMRNRKQQIRNKMSGGGGLIDRKEIMKIEKYDSLYFFQKIYIDLKNWLIESIAGSYQGERTAMHQLIYLFTPENNEVETSTTKTIKMAFYPFISLFVIFSSYFMGFAHCAYQLLLNNVIYSVIFFIGAFFMCMFVGATQFAELTIKLLFGPPMTYSKEIFTRISEQPQLLILVFSTMAISGAFDYLDSEICFAMTGFYFLYAIYSFYYFVSEKFPQFKISNILGISERE
jgi:hypothetical protein